MLVWAPVGHAIAYVLDNDVFYQSVHYPTQNTQRITNTSNTIFNGIADWVYEGKKIIFFNIKQLKIQILRRLI